MRLSVILPICLCLLLYSLSALCYGNLCWYQFKLSSLADILLLYAFVMDISQDKGYIYNWFGSMRQSLLSDSCRYTGLFKNLYTLITVYSWIKLLIFEAKTRLSCLSNTSHQRGWRLLISTKTSFNIYSWDRTCTFETRPGVSISLFQIRQEDNICQSALWTSRHVLTVNFLRLPTLC